MDECLFIIDNRYKVLKLIGDGLQAFVFEITLLNPLQGTYYQDKINQKFALKVAYKKEFKHLLFVENLIQTRLQHNPGFLKIHQYRQNLQITQINDKNRNTQMEQNDIIKVLSQLQNKYLDCLVMDYCNQGDLFSYLRQRGKLPLPVVKNFFNQILDRVEIIHDQVKLSHNDLKLENILMEYEDKNGNEETGNIQLKICDFGFSCGKNKNIMQARGSEGYKAPEVYFVHPAIGYDGVKADIFSLGVILFDMIFGLPPFSRATPDDVLYRQFYKGPNSFKYFFNLHPNTKNDFKKGLIDFEIIEIIMCMLDPNFSARPGSIQEIRQFSFFKSSENKEKKENL
ncbi:serine threonine-protein kinase ulk2 [Stylonychia lemnae]|uniref:Serine threonine-protein kinase ulk2 n=1 Tax=Stylonychia lemnae TaxID=5949 RepID=A0A078ACM6_STYLE|nr:serine threonine-protein kinase ulk2 [Stylonychia lemnae]|eukprot:CDW79934.1 serine threonine-protein kinase ulk2 [Stylonychia lemnae]